jgi:crotonobetainyl-CoA:carnitine CoA-transferase CaiB-like acyl-CoA transferase
MPQPLAGIRVLDLSRILAGPWATQILADLGAEVIKIERPATGDDTRGWGPPFVTQSADGDKVSSYFISANRGKRSVAIDFGQPRGADLVRRLAAVADVLVENFKVGGLRRQGLDYPSIAALNPRLVYCSVTGFGQTGPHRHRPGYDLIAQAMGGLMSVTGEADGQPMKSGPAVADIMTGLYATIAVLAALRERDASGTGQHIDVCLLDVQIAALAHLATNYLASGRSPGRWGNAHPTIVPYDSFATSDGHVIIAVGSDAQFERLAALIGAPELGLDARYQTNEGRVRNRDSLLPLLRAAIKGRPSAHWIAALEADGIPVGPINSIKAALDDPQALARGLITAYPVPGQPPVRTVANPIHLSRTPIGEGAPPPALGEGTAEVLRQLLGLTLAEVADLAAAGVIA